MGQPSKAELIGHLIFHSYTKANVSVNFLSDKFLYIRRLVLGIWRTTRLIKLQKNLISDSISISYSHYLVKEGNITSF